MFVFDLTNKTFSTNQNSGYSNVHPVIEKFWEAVANFDQSRRLKLLQFVTGTSSIPYEGFSALRGPNGPKKFTIEKWGSPASLPRLPEFLFYNFFVFKIWMNKTYMVVSIIIINTIIKQIF